MPQVTGVITGFDNKSIPNKSPGGRPYSVHIVLVDGVPYECGFKKPGGIGPGDTVTFEYEVKYGKNQLVGDFIHGRSPTASAPVAAPAKPAGGGGYGGGVPKQFPVPVTHPDRSIIRQNALAHATKLWCDGADMEGSGLSPEEQAEAIIQLAYKFEEYATGQREVNDAAAMTASDPR